MTKAELIKMGLTEEQAEKVMAGLDSSFVTKTQFDELGAELTAAKAAVKERDKQLEGLKTTTGDVDALNKQIAALQAENKAKDETHAAEMRRIKMDNAVEKALTGAKAKNTTAAKAMLAAFLEKAEFSDDSGIKGLDDEIKKLALGKDTAFLFDMEPPGAPTIAGAAPAGAPTATPDPKCQGYETRLAEARKTGDNLTAIKIKQEAAAEGVTLF